MKKYLSVLLALSMIGFMGCGEEESKDEGCPNGQVEVNGVCVPVPAQLKADCDVCSANDDCTSKVCTNGKCGSAEVVAKCGEPQPQPQPKADCDVCSANDDCTSKVCTNGKCGSAEVVAECDKTPVTTCDTTKDCVKEDVPVCFNEGANACVCNAQTGKWMQWSCKDNQCSIEGTTVTCPKPEPELEPCTAESNAECKDACKADGSEGYYWTGKLNTRVCKNGGCVVKDNRVECPEVCTGEVVTTGGAEGGCCDPATYEPTGCDTGLRCGSTGIIKKWGCSAETTCSFTTDGTCQGKTNCTDGHYDTEKYAKGFFECI